MLYNSRLAAIHPPLELFLHVPDDTPKTNNDRSIHVVYVNLDSHSSDLIVVITNDITGTITLDPDCA